MLYPIRLILLASLLSAGFGAFSQTIYEFRYHYTVDGVREDYRAFMLRNADGTGFFRVEYFDEMNTRHLVELPMVEIYGEHEDGTPDSTQLIFYAEQPRSILGNAGDYLPDHFVFEEVPDSGYYDPAFVYCVNEDQSQDMGTFDEVRLLDEKDLDKDLVLHYFTQQDDFYIQQFETVTRDLTPAEKQTSLHLVLVANTNDQSIGRTCVVDKEATYRLFSQVAEFLQIRFNPQVIEGQAFSKINVDKAISAVRPAPNDIVVFYYTGHGFNDMNQAYQFPYLDLRDKSFQQFGGAYTLNTESIFQKLKAKGARMNLVISDCCNNDPGAASLVVDEGATTRTSSVGWDQNNCMALFLSPKPVSLIMTAAAKGELSAGNASLGGIFTFNFRESLEKYMSPFTRNPDWNQLISSAKAQTIAKARKTWCNKEKKIICVQNPVFRVE